MNTSLKSKNYVRSNLFIPKEVDVFLKKEAKKQKTTKGNIVARALRLLEREKLRKEMEKYYQDPENRIYERGMAEESFFISDDE